MRELHYITIKPPGDPMSRDDVRANFIVTSLLLLMATLLTLKSWGLL